MFVYSDWDVAAVLHLLCNIVTQSKFPTKNLLFWYALMYRLILDFATVQ